MDSKTIIAKKVSLPLLIGAIGVVFGDIGTSPLYALKETFFGLHPLARNPENILGVLSLIFWTLMIVVTIKYILLIMRASNNGEGGDFAMLALLRKGGVKRIFGISITAVVLLGVTLLYGDGVITPAISVLSAVEGFGILSPSLMSYVVPLTIIILIGLFYIQKKGTGSVGRLFGPIMIFWFITLIILGLPLIIEYPQVLAAINPIYAYRFICLHAWLTFFVLSSIALCITGCEALYADMGHFNRRVITLAWLGLVYPALIINYFGQGALLLSGQEIVGNNIFYALAPQWAFLGVVILSTMAAIIASQALIAGVYSLTSQAVALGLFPKIKIVHTNPAIEGQIYIPSINFALAACCIVLVLTFRASGGLAAAYGIAVTGTMIISTLVFYALTRYLWKWPLWLVVPLFSFLLIIDISFFSGTMLKFWQGGYVPIVIAGVLFMLMSTWDWGRALSKKAHLNLPGYSVKRFVELQAEYRSKLLNRSIVVMSSRPIINLSDNISVALGSFLSKWGLYIPKHVVFMNVTFLNIPRVERINRYRIISFQDSREIGSVISVQVFYGYMQTPNIRRVLGELKTKQLIKIPSDPKKWLILVGLDRFTTETSNVLKKMRIILFNFMSYYSKPITSYYGLDSDNKVDIEIINI